MAAAVAVIKLAFAVVNRMAMTISGGFLYSINVRTSLNGMHGSCSSSSSSSSMLMQVSWTLHQKSLYIANIKCIRWQKASANDDS